MGSSILVIGSAGGVGRKVCAEVARQCGPGSLVLGDYRLERGESQARVHPGATSRRVDLRDATSIRDALAPELAGVIVCPPQERPEVQIACLERGIPCIDVTIEHEFNENPEYLYGQNSVNAGILSRWPLGNDWSLRTNAAVEAVPFGAVSNGLVRNRGYDFGVGGGVAFGARLYHRRLRTVELGYKAVWIHTVSGINDDNLVQFATARIGIPIIGQFGVGADGVLFLRNSHSRVFDDQRQRSPQLRVYTSWAVN